MTTMLKPDRIWLRPDDHYLCSLTNPWYAMLARLQSCLTELTIRFWSQRNGQTLHLPVTTGCISSPMGAGSDSLPVQIDLLGARTYLADSMQFMLEYGCRLTGSTCYYVMPSFRGEDSDESHLSQFFHSEAEIHGGLDDVIDVVEDYLVFLAQGLLDRHADDIAAAAGSIEHVQRLAKGNVFRRLTFDEAAVVLDGFGVRTHDGWRTLSRAGERALMEAIGDFTWVTDWDHLAVPFYQAYADSGRRRALNADLLFGLGEIIGAGERHETAEQVAIALAHHEVAPAPYEWYTRMREVRPLRTAGFGLGVERFLLWVLSHDDIRDMQLLPRIKGVTFTP